MAGILILGVIQVALDAAVFLSRRNTGRKSLHYLGVCGWFNVFTEHVYEKPGQVGDQMAELVGWLAGW